MARWLTRRLCRCDMQHLSWMLTCPLPAYTGEAQKIERIMEKFAERYCRDNPGQFRTADGAYVLSFALIMLNTDAHNPQADKKLSQMDFVNMCQDQVSMLFSPSCRACYFSAL